MSTALKLDPEPDMTSSFSARTPSAGLHLYRDNRVLSGVWDFQMEAVHPVLVVETTSAIESAHGMIDGRAFAKQRRARTLTILGRGGQLRGRARGTGRHHVLILSLSPATAQCFPEYPVLDLKPSTNLVDPQLHLRACNLIRSLSEPEPLLAELASSLLVAELLQKYGTYRGTHLRCKLRLTPLQVRRVVDFVDSELQNSLQIPDLAKICNLSEHYFITAFRETLGVSPHQFVLSKRVRRAKYLLGTSELPLCEVGSRCGFKTQSHFGNVFRIQVGVTPSRYRNTIRVR